MDKDSFNSLTVNEQVSVFNELLKENKTIIKSSHLLGINDTTIRKKFKKHGYSFVDGQFNKDTNILSDKKNHINKPVQENKKQLESQQVTNILDIQQYIDELMDKKFKVMLESQQKTNSKIQEIFEWYHDKKETDSNMLESKQLIINDTCNGDYRTRSFEVYTKILNDFMNFCDRKRFTRRELVSQALLEFMEKYK